VIGVIISMPSSTPLSSKKFIFAMTCNLAWLSILLYAVNMGLDSIVLTSIIYTAGATQVLYLGGQSALDAWVRGKPNNPPKKEKINHSYEMT